MNAVLHSKWFPFVALFLSNIFMTFAWYRHLKFKDHQSLGAAIFASWGLAFWEYCIAVPANRFGFEHFSLYQLKIAQEIITLIVFAGFAFFYFQTRPQWNHLAAFACLIGAVGFTFLPSK